MAVHASCAARALALSSPHVLPAALHEIIHRLRTSLDLLHWSSSPRPWIFQHPTAAPPPTTATTAAPATWEMACSAAAPACTPHASWPLGLRCGRPARTSAATCWPWTLLPRSTLHTPFQPARHSTTSSSLSCSYSTPATHNTARPHFHTSSSTSYPFPPPPPLSPAHDNTPSEHFSRQGARHPSSSAVTSEQHPFPGDFRSPGPAAGHAAPPQPPQQAQAQAQAQAPGGRTYALVLDACSSPSASLLDITTHVACMPAPSARNPSFWAQLTQRLARSAFQPIAACTSAAELLAFTRQLVSSAVEEPRLWIAVARKAVALAAEQDPGQAGGDRNSGGKPGQSDGGRLLLAPQSARSQADAAVVLEGPDPGRGASAAGLHGRVQLVTVRDDEGGKQRPQPHQAAAAAAGSAPMQPLPAALSSCAALVLEALTRLHLHPPAGCALPLVRAACAAPLLQGQSPAGPAQEQSAVQPAPAAWQRPPPSGPSRVLQGPADEARSTEGQEAGQQLQPKLRHAGEREHRQASNALLRCVQHCAHCAAHEPDAFAPAAALIAAQGSHLGFKSALLAAAACGGVPGAPGAQAALHLLHLQQARLQAVAASGGFLSLRTAAEAAAALNLLVRAAGHGDGGVRDMPGGSQPVAPVGAAAAPGPGPSAAAATAAAAVLRLVLAAAASKLVTCEPRHLAPLAEGWAALQHHRHQSRDQQTQPREPQQQAAAADQGAGVQGPAQPAPRAGAQGRELELDEQQLHVALSTRVEQLVRKMEDDAVSPPSTVKRAAAGAGQPKQFLNPVHLAHLVRAAAALSPQAAEPAPSQQQQRDQQQQQQQQQQLLARAKGVLHRRAAASAATLPADSSVGYADLWQMAGALRVLLQGDSARHPRYLDAGTLELLAPLLVSERQMWEPQDVERMAEAALGAMAGGQKPQWRGGKHGSSHDHSNSSRTDGIGGSELSGWRGGMEKERQGLQSLMTQLGAYVGDRGDRLSAPHLSAALLTMQCWGGAGAGSALQAASGHVVRCGPGFDAASALGLLRLYAPAAQQGAVVGGLMERLAELPPGVRGEDLVHALQLAAGAKALLLGRPRAAGGPACSLDPSNLPAAADEGIAGLLLAAAAVHVRRSPDGGSGVTHLVQSALLLGQVHGVLPAPSGHGRQVPAAASPPPLSDSASSRAPGSGSQGLRRSLAELLAAAAERSVQRLRSSSAPPPSGEELHQLLSLFSRLDPLADLAAAARGMAAGRLSGGVAGGTSQAQLAGSLNTLRLSRRELLRASAELLQAAGPAGGRALLSPVQVLDLLAVQAGQEELQHRSLAAALAALLPAPWQLVMAARAVPQPQLARGSAGDGAAACTFPVDTSVQAYAEAVFGTCQQPASPARTLALFHGWAEAERAASAAQSSSSPADRARRDGWVAWDARLAQFMRSPGDEGGLRTCALLGSRYLQLAAPLHTLSAQDRFQQQLHEFAAQARRPALFAAQASRAEAEAPRSVAAAGSAGPPGTLVIQQLLAMVCSAAEPGDVPPTVAADRLEALGCTVRTAVGLFGQLPGSCWAASGQELAQPSDAGQQQLVRLTGRALGLLQEQLQATSTKQLLPPTALPPALGLLGALRSAGAAHLPAWRRCASLAVQASGRLAPSLTPRQALAALLGLQQALRPKDVPEVYASGLEQRPHVGSAETFHAVKLLAAQLLPVAPVLARSDLVAAVSALSFMAPQLLRDQSSSPARHVEEDCEEEEAAPLKMVAGKSTEGNGPACSRAPAAGWEGDEAVDGLLLELSQRRETLSTDVLRKLVRFASLLQSSPGGIMLAAAGTLAARMRDKPAPLSRHDRLVLLDVWELLVRRRLVHRELQQVLARHELLGQGGRQQRD